MTISNTPMLYSFRRCPYEIRARLALASAGVRVVSRDVRLQEKPAAFLALSPSKTVPCFQDGTMILDESLEIMQWALAQNDPARCMQMLQAGDALIAENDGSFKQALDRVKDTSRITDRTPEQDRENAANFLWRLEAQLTGPFLFGATQTLADVAILPFIRQFAFVDKSWFDTQPWSQVQRWLGPFLISPAFLEAMGKYPAWSPGDPTAYLPD